ncbi:GTP 3',8-cyclase MoaA [Clostridium sediminicola]|uniref:GTP 3',8-cyclase MoaA n=1 Tax=Clostridium sediminicola TaxID=3114879 RepID=UPI0031F1CDDF
MIDTYGRKIEYLRISVTDRCNLRCIYCMPENGVDLLSHNEILTFEEIIRVAKTSAKLGINKIRITGGEPLARRGVIKLIKNIKSIPGIEEVSMTTNGIFLEKYIDDLADSGLDRINISLDTLNKERYKIITRNGNLGKVLNGIHLAFEKGIMPIKLNVVIIKEMNYSEIINFVELSEELPIDIRFIELMPIGEGKNFTSVSNDEIKEEIFKYRTLVPYVHKKSSGPATYFKTPNSKGSIGFISAMSHEFCDKCNRIRLTADGFLKLCLHFNTGIDLKKYLRNGVEDTELLQIISEAVKQKPIRHKMNNRFQSETDLELDKRNMFQIGG